MPAGVAEYKTTGTMRLDVGKCEPQPGILWAIELREEVTSGGIHLPDTLDAQKLRIGVCVRIGAGEPDGNGGEKYRFVKEGDFILFGRHQSGGEPFNINGVDLLLFRQNDIAAKYHKPEPWMVEMANKRRAKLLGLDVVPNLAAA